MQIVVRSLSSSWVTVVSGCRDNSLQISIFYSHGTVWSCFRFQKRCFLRNRFAYNLNRSNSSLPLLTQSSSKLAWEPRRGQVMCQCSIIFGIIGSSYPTSGFRYSFSTSGPVICNQCFLLKHHSCAMSQTIPILRPSGHGRMTVCCISPLRSYLILSIANW